MKTTKSCPKCRETLALDARACECGWTLRKAETAKAERPAVHCAHDACDVPAICRIQTATGWANFCEPHYVRYHDEQARKRNAEKGLDQQPDETRDEWIARMRAYVRSHAKLKRFADAALDEAA